MRSNHGAAGAAEESEMKMKRDLNGYGVYRTAFHEGGLVSRHRTEAGANRAAERIVRRAECCCGCVGVAPLADPPPEYSANGESYYKVCS